MKNIFVFLAVFSCLFSCRENPQSTSLGHVCLDVKMNISNAPGVAEKLLLLDGTRALLEFCGYSSSADVNTHCNGLLKIAFNGAALSNEYTDSVSRYTGARLAMDIQYITSDTVAFNKTVEGLVKPSLQATAAETTYLKSQNAPFNEALDNSQYYINIAAMIGQLYGKNVLSDALQKNRRVYVILDGRKIPFATQEYISAALKILE